MAESVGGISFDMEVDSSGIRTSINNCAREVNSRMTSAFNSAGRNVEASMQKMQKSVESATNKLNRQTTTIQAQKNAVDQLTTRLDRLKNKYTDQTNAIRTQESTIERLSQEYEELAQTIGALGVPTASEAKQLERLGKQLESARNKLASLNNQAINTKDAINSTSGSLNVANQRLNNTQTEVEQTRSEINRLNQSLDALSSQNVDGVSNDMNNLSRSAERLGDSRQDIDKLGDSVDDLKNVDSVTPKFDKLKSCIKKIGAVAAAAFAFNKLVDFGKEAIELGSDLAEVQNVVDVTFPQMSAQVDKFAKNAAAQFGLSETMAKKFSGTFGSMAKAFGFSEKEAYDMSTALTGLAGDVASFYNLSQDEAYTKLKSVFTGETESLKDLGVVMTQTALDSYALANGFGKTTAKMTEAEKVSLRYKFVQDQLSAASGDFARTSDGWANQVRVMQLNMDSLKASIGQGLINLFTPVIKVINKVISKLMVLADAFKSFTELITGNKSTAGSGVATDLSDVGDTASSTADDLNSASSAADKVAESTTEAGKAAKKAAKQLAMLSFDEIQKVSDDDDSDSSSSSNSGSNSTGSSADMGSLAQGDTVVDKLDSKLQSAIDRVKELGELFKQGFTLGVGDLSVFDSIKSNITSIGTSLKEIFTDKEVVNSANNFLNSLALNLGKITGSFVSVGATIADNLTGGLAKYLEQNKDWIKKKLVSIFDAGADIADVVGDITVALADIFTVFRNDDAKQITADFISIFTNAHLGIVSTALTIGADALKAISDPFIENKDSIKKLLEGVLSGISPIFSSLSDLVKNTFDSIEKNYNKYVKPAWESFSSGLSTILEYAIKAFDKYLLPVITKIGEEFKELIQDHIQPLIDVFLELAGKIIKVVADIWDAISPFVGWLVEGFILNLSTAFEGIWTLLKNTIAIIADIVKTGIENLSSWIDFLTGVFTGDWEKAWDAIKQMFENVWNGLGDIVENVWNFIKDIIDNCIENVKNSMELLWDGIKSVWESIKDLLHLPDIEVPKIGDIKEALSNTWDKAKEWWNKGKENLKEAVADVKAKIASKWEDLKQGWEDLTGNVKEKVADMKAAVASKWNDLKTGWSNLTDNIADKTAGMRAAVASKWNDLKQGWSDLTGNIADKTAGMKAAVASKWNDLKQGWSELTGNIADKTAGMRAAVESKWSDIKQYWSDITDNIKDQTAEMKAKIATTWSNLKTSWGNITSKIKNKTAEMKAKVATTWSKLKNSWGNITSNIKDKTAGFRAKVKTTASGIKNEWVKIANNFKDKTANFKAKLKAVKEKGFDKLKTAWSDFKSKTITLSAKFKDMLTAKLKAMWNGLATNINKGIHIINKIPGVDIPDIPKLAQGGYVKANTPQLAMIGDNRHQGEVVAPEGKLLEMAKMAASMTSGNGDAETVQLLKQVVSLLSNLNTNVYLDGKLIKQNVVNRINANTKATGKCEIII